MVDCDQIYLIIQRDRETKGQENRGDYNSMKVLNLTSNSKIYTSNAYLITGDWNSIEDVNTLIDVGRDPLAIDVIYNAPTGVGKKRIEQVILTHSHYDHASLLPKIVELFNPKVHAYSEALENVTHRLKGGEVLKVGDKIFDVIYSPGHSNDSVCLYCEEEKVLFAGDTPVVISSADCSYDASFITALETLCRKDVNTIYFGHGPPVYKGGNKLLRTSLSNVRKGRFKRNE